MQRTSAYQALHDALFVNRDLRLSQVLKQFISDPEDDPLTYLNPPSFLPNIDYVIIDGEPILCANSLINLVRIYRFSEDEDERKKATNFYNLLCDIVARLPTRRLDFIFVAPDGTSLRRPNPEEAKPESKPQRTCIDCSLTLSIDDFPKHKNGHRTRCIACFKKKRLENNRKYYDNKRQSQAPISTNLKPCQNCKKNKDPAGFKGNVCSDCWLNIHRVNQEQIKEGKRTCILCLKMKLITGFARSTASTYRNECKECLNVLKHKKPS